MKYGITKQYIADQKDGGGNGDTADVILKELGTMRDALKKNLEEDASKWQKNADEKLEAVNKTIEELKAAKPEMTAEEANEIREDIRITKKAFDILQDRVKINSAKGNNHQGEDESFIGKLKAGVMELKSNIHGDSIKGGKYITNIQLKAVGDMTVANSVSTGVVPSTYRNGYVLPPFEMVHVRDIVTVSPSETDSYHFFRFTLGEGTIEFQTNENTEKPQLDDDLAEQVVNLNYLAGWMRISKKMLRNFKLLQATLAKWLPERYYRREDTKAYQALLSAIGGNTTYAGVAGESIAAVIIKNIGRQMELGYSVNGIVLDGTAWASLMTFQASTSGIYTNPTNVVTVTNNGQISILGIPVRVASWVGGSEVIIGDWKNFEIIQSEGLSLQFFDQDGTNVRENKITARIEASVGFAVLDPLAFLVVSLDSVS